MHLQNLQAEFAEMIFSDEPAMNGIIPAGNILIYKNNRVGHLVKALQHTYPLLEQLVGEHFFCTAAKEYIKYYPARSGNLHDYGEYMGDFLSEYKPAKQLLYLKEVALFEWTCHTLYFAADHAFFDPERLKNFPADHYQQLRFMLHPACRVLRFQYPIQRIIDLCKEEKKEPIEIQDCATYLLIIRRDLDIMFSTLPESDYLFLKNLDEEKTLAEATSLAISINPNFNLEEKLPVWMKNKIIVDCYLEKKE